MKKDRSGKVFTIFILIAAVLLISLTAITLFFLKEEMKTSELTQKILDKTKTDKYELEDKVKDLSKQMFLQEEKSKEADERINSLMDELDLEEGLREEIKAENITLKQELDALKKENQSLNAKVNVDVGGYEQKIAKMEVIISKNENQIQELKKLNGELQSKSMQLEQKIYEMSGQRINLEAVDVDLNAAMPSAGSQTDEIKNITAAPSSPPVGRILSIDKDTDFVIINLGEKDGVTQGEILSVYRAQEYLGDIRATRIQSEMSAADLIPPLSTKVVRKNDEV